MPARPPLTTRMLKQQREALGGARADPMGKRSHENLDARYKLLVEVDLLAYVHPAIRPKPMYYNV